MILLWSVLVEVFAIGSFINRSTLSIYVVGHTLNKLTLGFLFYGDKVTVITVIILVKIFLLNI